MPDKPFRLEADEIAPIAVGHGAATATDRILVDGLPVGFLYRDPPRDGRDSGWRFFAGDESDAYLANTSNSGVYDVNTVANYDPSVIPLLDAAVGSAFERDANGDWVLVED